MSSFFAFGLDAGKPIADLAKSRAPRQRPPRPLGRTSPSSSSSSGEASSPTSSGPPSSSSRTAPSTSSPASPASTPCAPPTPPATPSSTSTPSTPPPTTASPPRTLIANYIFAAMAGVIWYFQFFFYSMGQTKMGKYDFSSWTLHMASIIIFATLWGLVLKEWRGTSRAPKSSSPPASSCSSAPPSSSATATTSKPSQPVGNIGKDRCWGWFFRARDKLHWPEVISRHCDRRRANTAKTHV